ncbi:MAG: hypothetical protein M3O46_03060 [Myxococcota bacterium]|nr:hypothetical protein [Myxococcota bacterium]
MHQRPQRRWALGRRYAVIAFAIGCGVHLALLALTSYWPELAGDTAMLMMVVALPGLLIDISCEVIRPDRLGAAALLTAATAANGAIYVAIALLVARFAAYRRGRPLPPET